MTQPVQPRGLKELPIVTDLPSGLRLGQNRIGADWRLGASHSGIGRTGGRHTLLEMSDLKTVTLDVSR